MRRLSFSVLLLSVALAAADGASDVQALHKEAKQLRLGLQYAKAVVAYEATLTAARKEFGATHELIAGLQNELASMQTALGKFDTAARLYESSQTICEKKFGKEHLATAMAIENRASFYKTIGQFNTAEGLYLDALRISEKVLGETHVETASTRHNVALFYQTLGQYAKAEALLTLALQHKLAQQGSEHPSTWRTQQALANVQHTQGRTVAAEKIYVLVLGQKERKLGKDHPEVALTLHGLANLFSDVRQFAAAEKHLDRALVIAEATLGREHPQTLRMRHDRAVLHKRRQEFRQAETLYQQVLATQERVFGKEHPETALTIQNLADLYRDAQQPAKGEPLAKQALAIFERLYGPDHPQTALVQHTLADLYLDLNEYRKAEPLLDAAENTCRTRLGPGHPRTAGVLASRVTLLLNTRRTTDALRTQDRVQQVLRQHTAEVLPMLTERQQLDFVQGLHDPQLARGLTLSLTATEAKDRNLVAAWLLNGKAIVAESLTERQLLTRDAETKAARELLAQLDDVRAQLAAHALNVQGPRDARERAALQEREAKLTEGLAAFASRPRRANAWLDHDELRQQIPANSVLIDLARFPSFDFVKGRFGPERYVAVLTFRTAPTQVVDLGLASAIDAAIKDVRAQFTGVEAKLKELGEPEAEKQLRTKLVALGKLVLDPLRPSINAATHWLIAPDGALGLVPWAILPEGTGYVIEKRRLQYVVSGRDLLRKAPVAGRGATETVIVADPDFDLEAKSVEPTLLRGFSKDFRLPKVRSLPNTAAEAEAIAPLLQSLFKKPPTVFLNDRATTTAVRRVQRPRVLVLSTHGFFLADEHAGGTTENPLLRCGLLFAGCNNASKGDSGVLTGLEIVGLDLRGTQLVVLSACETGLGDVANGQGVVGLRHAFQLAGAASVVATLWQVPDQDSALLMKEFFAQLSKGQARSEALQNAQIQMLERRRQRFNAAHPFFWAGYTVTGVDR